MSKLYTDAALQRVEQDKDELQVMPFVRRLVRPILQWPATEGFVVGLYGPWGYGKTTILNFLEAELEKVQPSGARGIVVRFNPWLYGTPEAMLASFFGTLASAVKQVTWLPSEAQRLKGLSSALQGVGALVPVAATSIGLPAAAPFLGLAVAGLAKLAKSGEEDLRKKQNAARAHLIALGAHKARLVVLIDDVDRAERPEILALLKLVKLIGDLPNTTYVLAMDDSRVRQLLDNVYAGETGAAYLEKIVQAPVYLPLIPPEKLKDLMKSALLAVMEEAGIPGDRLFSSEWQIADLYSGTLGMRVGTLRDRARLANGFRFFLASSDDLRDVNVEDALLVVFLQTFYPDVYERVRTNKGFLTAEDERFQHMRGGDDVERSRRRRESLWFRIVAGISPEERTISENDGVSKILTDDPGLAPIHMALKRMFPYAISGYQPGEVQLREQRRRHDIRAFEEFDRYFQLRPPPDEVPDYTVNALLEEVVLRLQAGEWPAKRSEIAALFDDLKRYNRGQRVSFVNKVRDRLDSMPVDVLAHVVIVLLDAQAELPERELSVTLLLAISYIYAEALGEGHTNAAVKKRAAEAVTSVLLDVLRQMHDCANAVAFAEDFLRGRNGWDLPEEVKLAIAGVVLDRLREFAATKGNPFSNNQLDFHSLFAIWMFAEKIVGEGGTDRRAFLRLSLSDSLDHVASYVYQFSLHRGSGRISFAPSDPREGVLAYHEQLIGLNTLRELLTQFLESDRDDPYGAVSQAREYFTAA